LKSPQQRKDGARQTGKFAPYPDFVRFLRTLEGRDPVLPWAPAFTGLYMFVLPYTTRWRSARHLTVRQLAQIAGSYGGLALVGTPKMIADQMEEWLHSDACDGFNIMFPWVPGGLDDFVDRIVPELQRRHLFRREYEGKTLRENLGLPRPENRFFDKPGF
jgi:alkanesulfonate monooxygenase SsuD/methylene tetrahydromethanopterin reductase-like flavin-dependent oxidoreductase (luciferase family)